MQYGELLQHYYERSSALQGYWTLYVVVIGGLLAFSSLRVRRDLLTVVLVSILYCFFAYKNLGAIHDTMTQRSAAYEALHAYPSPSLTNDFQISRAKLESALVDPGYAGTRNFHVVSDLLVIAAIWAMERRRAMHPVPTSVSHP